MDGVNVGSVAMTCLHQLHVFWWGKDSRDVPSQLCLREGEGRKRITALIPQRRSYHVVVPPP
jgi:hypothetical protein